MNEYRQTNLSKTPGAYAVRIVDQSAFYFAKSRGGALRYARRVGAARVELCQVADDLSIITVGYAQLSDYGWWIYDVASLDGIK